jgi:hypothetical protein
MKWILILILMLRLMACCVDLVMEMEMRCWRMDCLD